MTVRYATLCSGLGSFDKGFDDAGMECVYQCEADAVCRSVLERHWPFVPKGCDVYDDQTESDLVRLRPDIIAFGSPCQDLSVAGRREGIFGERSGVFFRCVELCFAAETPVVLWENVPGAFSSNGGEDFACVLEAFTGYAPAVPRGGWRNTGVCIGPLYSVAWRVLDAQWFGVPQRRRRIFLVGCLSDRGRPYEILSLGDSLPWDSPPSRETGTRVAGTIAARTSGGGGLGTDFDCDGGLVPAIVENGDAHSGFRDANEIVAHTLRSEGHDAIEDGTGRGVPLVAHALTATATATGRLDPNGETFIPEVSFSIGAAHRGVGQGHNTTHVGNRAGVRRLMPVETERLQGLPDDWTRYDANGKEISDSKRYHMIGNAGAVPVLEWIGRRIIKAYMSTEEA
jgi:DNA (cytosine-5)-methyltransferase 1